MRLLWSLDHWKYMAREAQSLVVTCEDGWVSFYTALKSLSGEETKVVIDMRLCGEHLKLPAGRIKKWEDNVKNNFDVLLTMHLSIILVTDQLNTQILVS